MSNLYTTPSIRMTLRRPRPRVVGSSPGTLPSSYTGREKDACRCWPGHVSGRGAVMPQRMVPDFLALLGEVSSSSGLPVAEIKDV